MQFFALTARGLEDIAAGEMASIAQLRIRERAYRRVLADFDGPAAQLVALRTVDDVFIHLADWRNVAHTRDYLTTIADLSARLELEAARAVCRTLRPIGDPVRFSVTANFVGRRNYSADEIKLAVARGVAAGHGWVYQPDDAAAAINIRVFIEHDTALAGIRLAARPLHERPYKLAHRPGSLKPSVAAAMLRLGRVDAGTRLLDPFCGAGTILVEAALAGAHSAGGDIDAEAVETATANARAAGVDAMIRVWDARSLPLAGGSIDAIVSNPPWGRQIASGMSLTALYRDSLSEMQRVLAEHGRIVLLVGEPTLVHAPALRIEQDIEISLFGQTPRIVVYAPR
jgi:tRNA (guanine6-N2)-methyltransferase